MMLDFQQKRKVRSFIYNNVTIVVLFLLLMVIVHSTWRVYRKKVDSEEMMSISEKNVKMLRSRSLDIQNKIDRLSTQEGVEEEVRSKFSVSKEGENMVIIVQEKPTTTEQVDKTGFWASILGFLSKK